MKWREKYCIVLGHLQGSLYSAAKVPEEFTLRLQSSYKILYSESFLSSKSMRLQPMLSPADTLPLYLCLYVILSYSEQPLSKQSSRAEFISFFFFCNIEYFNLLQVHLQYTQQKYLRRLLEISLQTFNFFDQKFLRHGKTIKISVYN